MLIHSLQEKSEKDTKKKDKFKLKIQKLKDTIETIADELQAHKDLVSTLTNENFKLRALYKVPNEAEDIRTLLYFQETVQH